VVEPFFLPKLDMKTHASFATITRGILHKNVWNLLFIANPIWNGNSIVEFVSVANIEAVGKRETQPAVLLY
jgi:hypothetical protein